MNERESYVVSQVLIVVYSSSRWWSRWNGDDGSIDFAAANSLRADSAAE